jgi:hypothetical protein
MPIDKRSYMGQVKLVGKPSGNDMWYKVEGTSGAIHPVSAIGATAAAKAKLGTPFKLYITSKGMVTYYELERI